MIILLKYRNILRHELELKWIQLLQTPHPLSFNNISYHDSNILDYRILMAFFSFLDIRKRRMRVRKL